jgi:hypothetical protein
MTAQRMGSSSAKGFEKILTRIKKEALGLSFKSVLICLNFQIVQKEKTNFLTEFSLQ